MQLADLGILLMGVAIFLFLFTVCLNNVKVQFICILFTIPIAILGFYLMILSEDTFIVWLCEKFNLIKPDRINLFLFGITFITMYFSYIVFTTNLCMKNKNNKPKTEEK